MKFLRFLAVAVMFFTAAALFAADDELPVDATPMDMLNFLRHAAIKNDSSLALQVVHGQMAQQMIRTGKIPKDLREKMLNLTAAFEDTCIRQTSGRAVIYAIIDQNGKKSCFQIKFSEISEGVLRLTEITPGTIPGARVYLERFLNACNDGNKEMFHAFLSEALKNQFPDIPAGLQPHCQAGITQRQNSDTVAIFSVTRSGITGNIKLTKDKESFFWEIAEIDPVLTAPLPQHALWRLADYTKIYLQHRDSVVALLRQERENATNVKRAAKTRFYEEAKNRAVNDEALKDEIGKPEQVVRDFIEEVYIPRMLKDYKNYVKEEINYYENIISATEAEIEVEYKEIVDGDKLHSFYKYKLRKNGDTWQIVTQENDSSKYDLQETTAEWIAEIPDERLRALMQEVIDVAFENIAPFFADGYLSQEMFTDTDTCFNLLELLSAHTLWQSQVAANGDVAVTVKNPANGKTEKIIFARVGREWKIKAVPEIKPPKKQQPENNAEEPQTNAE